MEYTVSISDVSRWGCPYCGYRSISTPMSGAGVALARCGDCAKGFVILADNLQEIPEQWSSNNFPKLSAHPREGIASHGRPDERPDEGEHFFSRGIGSDSTPGCFVCGGPEGLHSNISGFVQCREAGERVVKLVGQGVWMDYREHSPDRIQVKIGACKGHLPHLQNLHLRTTVKKTITYKMVEDARNTVVEEAT